MNIMDGVETAVEIRKEDEDVILIYMSSYETYFKELFQVRPFDFIQKPMNFDDFYKVFKNAFNYLNKSKYFIYNYRKDQNRVEYNDIYYFVSDAREINIIGSDGYKLGNFYEKLDNIEGKLEITKEPFIRAHKSYIINFRKIKTLRTTEIILLDDTIITISKRYKEFVKKRFLELSEIYG